MAGLQFADCLHKTWIMCRKKSIAWTSCHQINMAWCVTITFLPLHLSGAAFEEYHSMATAKTMLKWRCVPSRYNTITIRATHHSFLINSTDISIIPLPKCHPFTQEQSPLFIPGHYSLSSMLYILSCICETCILFSVYCFPMHFTVIFFIWYSYANLLC